MFTVLDIPTPVLTCTMLKAQRKGMQMLGYLIFWSYMLLPKIESLQFVPVRNKGRWQNQIISSMQSLLSVC